MVDLRDSLLMMIVCLLLIICLINCSSTSESVSELHVAWLLESRRCQSVIESKL